MGYGTARDWLWAIMSFAEDRIKGALFKLWAIP
jgi:hypothetical protein